MTREKPTNGDSRKESRSEFRIGHSRVDALVQALNEIEAEHGGKIEDVVEKEYESLDVILHALTDALEEREAAILKIEAEEDLKYTTSGSIEQKDLSEIEGSIIKIDQALEKYKDFFKFVELADKEKIADKETPSEVLAAAQSLNAKALAKIHDYKDLINADNVDEDLKQEIYNFISDEKAALENSISQLTKTYTPDVTENLKKTLNALNELYISLAEAKTKKIEPEEKHASETTVVENTKKEDEVGIPEFPEEIKNYEHGSIKKEISGFKNRIGREGGNEALKAEISAFIADYMPKLEYRKNVLENAVPLDIGSIEYANIQRDLIALKNLRGALMAASPIEQKTADTKVKADKKAKSPNQAALDDLKAKLEPTTPMPEEPSINHEDEVFTSYESVIQSMIRNENPEARSIFLHEHRAIIKDLSKQISKIPADEINNFIKKQQEGVTSLITLLKQHGSYDAEENGLLLNALRADFDTLEEFKKKDEPKAKEKNAASDLEKTLSPEKIKILKTNPELSAKIEKAVADYNLATTSKASPEIIEQCKKDIDKLLLKFEKYEKSYKPARKEVQQWKGYRRIKLMDEMEFNRLRIMKLNDSLYTRVEKAIEEFNDKLDRRASEASIEESWKKIQGLQDEFRAYEKEYRENEGKGTKKNTAPTPTPEKPTKPELLKLTPGMDYSEITKDKKFDAWFSAIETSIEKSGMPPELYANKLENWYASYQESIPYQKKLNTMLEAVTKTAQGNPILMTMSKQKIDSLLFDVYSKGEEGKKTVDSIYSNYEKSKLQEAEIVRQKQTDELREAVRGRREQKDARKELTADEAKQILEARGDENTKENINDLISFLEDMKNNYDFYSPGKENAEGDITRVYSRYKTAGRRGEKIPRYSKPFLGLGAKIKAGFTNVLKDPVDYQNTANLIRKTRELNLVDRKNGNTDKAAENKSRMEALIEFCKQNKDDLLLRHIQDPEATKNETLTETQKNMLKLFDGMFDTLATSKYRGREAKEKAESILIKQGMGHDLEKPESISSILFELDNKEDVQAFEIQATKDVYSRALTATETEIDKLTKGARDAQKLRELKANFIQFANILETVDESDESKIRIKSINQKIENIEMQYVDKKNFKELSSAFPLFDQIINSPERTADEKKAMVKELIENLEGHIKNKGNTKAQNAVLNATIKEYQAILKKL